MYDVEGRMTISTFTGLLIVVVVAIVGYWLIMREFQPSDTVECSYIVEHGTGRLTFDYDDDTYVTTFRLSKDASEDDVNNTVAAALSGIRTGRAIGMARQGE